MIKRLVPLFFLLTISFNLFSYFDYNEKCKTIHTLIVDLKLEKASQLLNQEKKNSPKNSTIHYLENYSNFIKLILLQEKDLYDSLNISYKTLIETVENDTTSSELKYYYTSEMHMHWTMLNMVFDDKWYAGQNFYNALLSIKKNQKLYPKFKGNIRVLALMNIIAGSIPKEFKWTTGLIGFKGSIDKGIALMEKAYKYSFNSNYKIENALMLSSIYMGFSDDKLKALNFLANTNISLKNPLYRYIYSSAATNSGKNDIAINTLLSYKQELDECYFAQLDYSLGLCKLYRSDKDANIYFNRFLKLNKSKNYIKDTHQKLYWYYVINNDITNANKQKNLVLRKGEETSYSDKQALKEIGRFQNKILIQARLYFDGGYYKKSLEVLYNNKSLENYSTRVEKIEYLYRLARIYQELEEFNKAIDKFTIIVKKASNLNYYYAAHSYLQMGIIYEKLNDLDKAKTAFTCSLNTETDEYKQSIYQKAKEGLERVSKLLAKN